MTLVGFLCSNIYLGSMHGSSQFKGSYDGLAVLKEDQMPGYLSK